MRIIYYLKVIKSVKAFKKLTEVLSIEVLLEMGRKSGKFKLRSLELLRESI